jgi:acetyltransferase-like isoleucine patch superfamily enzyme
MPLEDLGNVYRLRITQEVAEALAERRVFRQGPTGHVPAAEGVAVHFLKTTTIEPYTSFIGRGDLVTMGSFSYTHSPLPATLSVGRYCSIAGGLIVFGEQHPTDRATTSVWSYRKHNVVVGAALDDYGVVDFPFHPPPQKQAPVIGNDVWIGERVMLARGVVIGDGAIVGAGAVVTRSIEPFSIVGGNPARVIRRRFSDALCERYLRACWWNYALAEVNQPDLRDPERFIAQIERFTESGELRRYHPPVLDADTLVNIVRNAERAC